MKLENVPNCSYLKKDPASGIYYVRKAFGDKGRLFRSTGTTKKNLAQTLANEMIAEFAGRRRGMKNVRVRVSQLCEDLLKQLEEDTKTQDQNGKPIRRLSTFESKDLPFLRGEGTRLTHQRKGTNERGVIREHFGELYIDQIDEVFWKSWVKKTGRRLGRNLGDIAKYLSKVLTYAFEEKYIARKPRIHNPDNHQRKAVVISDEDVIKMFHAAESTLKDLIVIASENPIRPHENREVRWDMIEIKGDQVTYDLPDWFVKRNARKIQLTPNAAKVIKRRWEARKKLPKGSHSPYVFASPRDANKPLSKRNLNSMWHRMKATAQIPAETKIHFHWFRHNVYRRLLKIHNVPIGSVSQVGGTSIATLQKHYDLEEEQAVLDVSKAIKISFEPEGEA